MKVFLHLWIARLGAAIFTAALVMAMVFTLTGCDQASGTGKSDPESGKTEDLPEEPFTGAVLSKETGVIAKGATRQFSVTTKVPVEWTVEGGSDGGGTFIDDDGVLTIGKNEASITLVVRAKSAGEELGAAVVKLQGWKDLTGKLKDIFADGKPGSVGLGAFVGITAAAYGNGRWVIAGRSADDWWFTAVAWSDDDGETWHRAEIPVLYQETIESIAYGGPAGNEKFVLGGYLSHAFYSSDGAVWKKVKNVIPPRTLSNPNEPNPLINMVYGEVEGAGVFIASNSTGKFSTSPDGVNWTYGGWANPPNPGERVDLINHTILYDTAYGSGLVNGEQVPMFKGWGLGTAVYSVNGASWTLLTPEAEDALHFVPSVPNSGYENIGVQAVNTAGGPMFKKAIFTGGKKGSSNHNVYGRYVPCADDGSVYVYENTDPRPAGWDYEKHISFIVPGGGKYLAVGVGNRAAIAHAEAFE
jgi:hypothetical protein